MEEKLLKLSFFVSIIGILLLFFICELRDISEVEDIDIHDDEKIKINGLVSSISKRSNVTFIELSFQKKIKIVAFDEISNLSEGSNIEVIGSVSEDSVIASRIMIVS